MPWRSSFERGDRSVFQNLSANAFILSISINFERVQSDIISNFMITTNAENYNALEVFVNRTFQNIRERFPDFLKSDLTFLAHSNTAIISVYSDELNDFFLPMFNEILLLEPSMIEIQREIFEILGFPSEQTSPRGFEAGIPLQVRSSASIQPQSVQRPLMPIRPVRHVGSPPVFSVIGANIVSPSIAPSDEDCSICTENLRNGQTLVRTRCGHYFHRDCMLGWQRPTSDTYSYENPIERNDPHAFTIYLKNYTCPNCRANLVSER